MPEDPGMSSDGLVIALCGPDGTGKTTLAAGLEERLPGETLQLHHRPEFLPYPGVDESRDFTEPYALPPRGRARSISKAVYLYLDWLLAWVFRIRPWTRNRGSVIIQRPWPDLRVDPHRYRLDVPDWLLRWLGHLMPAPDISFLLTAPPEVIRARKGELTISQIHDQAKAWVDVLGRTAGTVEVDVSRDVESTVNDMVALIAAEATAPAPDLLTIQDGRWILPRRPRRSATEAIRVFHPIDLRGRALAAIGRALARSGFFRLAPRSRPPEKLDAAISPWLGPGATFAARRLRGGDRWFALIIDRKRGPGPALKIGISTEDRSAIEAEKLSIQRVETLLPENLQAPRLLRSPLGVMAMEPIEWESRKGSLWIPDDVASGLGTLFRTTATESHGGLRGRVHGDLTPWNILWDGTRWVLVDWEESRPDGEAFHDILHYFVQAYALLSEPSGDVIVRGLATGEGPVGRAIAAFADGAHLDPTLASSQFSTYLATSRPDSDPSAVRLRTALARRKDLMDLWEAAHAAGNP